MDIKLPTFPKHLLLAALSGLPVFAAAADLNSMAHDLAEGARSAGLHRIAVARLEPAHGHDDGRADALTDGVTVALVRTGRVQAVERSMIGKLAEEIKLDRTGAVAGAADRETGISAVDALVVGRYEIDGGRVRVYARVVDAQSGVIVAAATADIADTQEVPALHDSVSSVNFIAPTSPAASSPRLDCATAAQELTARQENLLSLKARYWAFRLRLGLDDATAAADARATIPDLEQRSRYMDELSAWSAADVLPPMRAAELADLNEVQSHAKEVVRDCGL
jgi:TolB-like protein